MSEQLSETTVELLAKMTDREINLWRLANSKAASDAEAKKAAWLLVKSIRERGGRYTVRELGKGSYNAAV
jgi:hypothetical protein